MAGPKKWQSAHADYFPAGAKVVLLPDQDSVGAIHMRLVKNLLRQRKCDVTLLKLDGVSEKGDVSDWIDAGHTKEEFLKMLTEEGTGKFALTDVGNAERLAAQHGWLFADRRMRRTVLLLVVWTWRQRQKHVSFHAYDAIE
jgi:hypothetical protein